MTGTPVDLDAVKADLAATQIDRQAGEVCCEGWWYNTVRHVLRNMEMECSVHGEYGDDPKPGRECGPAGRYDGPAIGRLLAAAPALVAEVERLRALLQEVQG